MAKRNSTEAQMWSRIKKKWWGHAVRVEASMGDAEAGTPDTNLSIGRRGGWVELKVWPEPMRVSQRVWHTEALRDGAFVYVLAELPDGKYWLGHWYEYEELGLGLAEPMGERLVDVLQRIEKELTGNG